MKWLPMVMLGLTAPTFASQKNPSCPADSTMPRYMLSPGLVKTWLKNPSNNIQSIDDLVCCLPADLQKNFLVGQDSIAGQPGVPDNPRVIMFDGGEVENRLQTPKIIMSLNGGAHGMAQADSMEMAYLNPQTKQYEFYDLDFSDFKRPVLTKNPESCMNCHGDSGKVPPGGPKLIFDTGGSWPRFAGGAMDCTPEDNRNHDAIADHAIQAVQSKPRFKCLDFSVMQKDATKTVPEERYPLLTRALGNFDDRIGLPRARQAGAWMRSLPTYDKYKYYLAGEQICGNMKESDWLPADVLRKDKQNLQIDPALKKDGDLYQNYQEALRAEMDLAAKRRTDTSNSLLTPTDVFKKGGINAETSSQSCNKGSKPNELSLKRFTAADWKNKSVDLLTTLDWNLHGPPLFFGKVSPAKRLFLEGEGYGTFLIQSSTAPGDLVDDSLSGVFPLRLEPSDSSLKDLFVPVTKPTGRKNLIDVSGVQYTPKNPQTICADLKSLSLNAFKPATQSPSSATGQP